MAEAFTARSTARDQVEREIGAIEFPTDGGSYDVETLTNYVDAAGRVLTGIYNPDDPAKGVSDLLAAGSRLSLIKSSTHYTADKVLALRAAQAKKKKAANKAAVKTDDEDGFIAVIPRSDAQ